ncbi:hypothetical protein R8510_03040 [Ralstonia chuxiongensis]|nr:hypothetical protein R8510_03040 [Ralstonia chuxiongensis]
MKSRTQFLPADFPLRPKAMADESVRLYIHRVHRVNGHRPGIPFLERSRSRPWFEATDRLQTGARYEAPFDLAEHLTYLPGRTLDSRNVKYCSACSRELGYQLWTTDCYDSRICPVHLCQLQHVCPACGRPLEPFDVLAHACPCGFDLREAVQRVVRADAAVLELALGRHFQDAGLRARSQRHRRKLLAWMQVESLLGLVHLFAELHAWLVVGPMFRLEDEVRSALVAWPTHVRSQLLACGAARRGPRAERTLLMQWLDVPQ